MFQKWGTSLVVQWLRLHAANAGGLGLIPGQGTRSHMLQLKNSYTATKIKDCACHNQDLVQPNKIFKNVIRKMFEKPISQIPVKGQSFKQAF